MGNLLPVKRASKKVGLPSPMKRMASKASTPIPHPHAMKPISASPSPSKNAAMHISMPVGTTSMKTTPFPTKHMSSLAQPRTPVKRLATKSPIASPMKRMAKKAY